MKSWTKKVPHYARHSTTYPGRSNPALRAAKQLRRRRGARSFFEKRRTSRGGTVLTVAKLAEAQRLLNNGKSRSGVAGQIDVKRDTLRKAVNDGRLVEQPENPVMSNASTMSERSRNDNAAAAEMGTACTRPVERAYAATGLGNGADVRFESCFDVPHGGVLCAIPALLSNGLMTGLEKLGEIVGYYTNAMILLTISFMCLCRIRTVEQLRGYAPGELGKLLGIDRIPEARYLRIKMDDLAADTKAEEWSAMLSGLWMKQSLDAPGFLYVDGHIKVYNGSEKLPRRYVSRQRLCLRGISHYWVNDAIGQPFFVVERQIDDGLLQTLRRDIVPRLLRDVPSQPGDEQLENDHALCRFVVVFDREGYSPGFFKDMWDQHRIACITYLKNCKGL